MPKITDGCEGCGTSYDVEYCKVIVRFITLRFAPSYFEDMRLCGSCRSSVNEKEYSNVLHKIEVYVK